jgi:hypothetical protein
MSMEKRLEMQRLCAEIERVVGDEQINFVYPGKAVEVSVKSRERAAADDRLIEAVRAFRATEREPAGEGDPVAAKAELLAAFDHWVEVMARRPF